MEIVNMEPVEPGVYDGGVVSLGAYKEGACFKLVEQSGNSWVLCGDNTYDVEEWMRYIAVLKLRTETQSEMEGD